MTLLLALLASSPDVEAAPRSNFQLSKRVNLRYEDVIVTRSGNRWRGKIVERADVYRIRLADLSEIAIPKEDIASVTRELHPGMLHNAQFSFRVTPGGEFAFQIGEGRSDPAMGLLLEVALGYNIGGAFEPEVTYTVSPIGPDELEFNAEFGLGLRYFLQSDSRVKAYTNTQLILAGQNGDLGLRTGPGVLWDVGQNFGLGFNQGITLMVQTEAVAIGYHVGVTTQFRF